MSVKPNLEALMSISKMYTEEMRKRMKEEQRKLVAEKIKQRLDSMKSLRVFINPQSLVNVVKDANSIGVNLEIFLGKNFMKDVQNDVLDRTNADAMLNTKQNAALSLR
jgi:hypothetical protein